MEAIPVPNILARRSVRHYTPEPVGEEQITILLEAAMAAPSAAIAGRGISSSSRNAGC